MSVCGPRRDIITPPVGSQPVFPRPERMILRNGLRVVLVDLPWSHWVGIQAAVHAGAMYEDEETAGVSHFLEHLRCRSCRLPKGPMPVDDALDALGVYLDAYTSPDHTAYLLQVRPENQVECLDLLRCMMFWPDISSGQVEVEKQVVHSEYASGSDDPEQVENVAREHILGTDGLGRSSIGTPESIRRLTVETLRRFDERVYSPGNMVLVLAGRLDRKALEPCWREWEEFDGKAKGRPRIERKDPRHRASPVPGPRIIFERAPRSSYDLVFAYPGFAEGDPAGIPASMLRHVLHKRISDRLRASRNPLYDLWFHMHSYEREGIYYVGARVTGYLVQTVSAIYGELLRARDRAPSKEEMARAREWNRTYLVQMLDRPEEYAARLAIEELYETSLDPAAEWQITGEIGEADIQQVAGTLFVPGSLTFCLLGSPGFREKRSIRRLLRDPARRKDI